MGYSSRVGHSPFPAPLVTIGGVPFVARAGGPRPPLCGKTGGPPPCGNGGRGGSSCGKGEGSPLCGEERGCDKGGGGGPPLWQGGGDPPFVARGGGGFVARGVGHAASGKGGGCLCLFRPFVGIR